MPTIVNGKVVDKKPFSLLGLIYAILNFIQLFIQTLLPSSLTLGDRVERFNNAKKPGFYASGGGGGGGRPGGGGGGGANIRGVDHRQAAAGSCGGGGGG